MSMNFDQCGVMSESIHLLRFAAHIDPVIHYKHE